MAGGNVVEFVEQGVLRQIVHVRAGAIDVSDAAIVFGKRVARKSSVPPAPDRQVPLGECVYQAHLDAKQPKPLTEAQALSLRAQIAAELKARDAVLVAPTTAISKDWLMCLPQAKRGERHFTGRNCDRQRNRHI